MSRLDGTTIVFDLDGTLVDTAPDLIRATNHALESIGLGPCNGNKIRDSISFGARRMITDALQDADYAIDENGVDRLHARFIAHYEGNIAHSSRPYRDAVATLQQFRHAGARLAVCTNKREHLARSLLAALDMTDLFEAVAGLETFAVSKPHPEHILGTVRLAGGDVRRAVMVGDSENDVKAARAGCVPVIGYLHGYSDIPMCDLKPDAVFGSYDELGAAVERLVTTSNWPE
jgi:phosphoglycolate phosphatase